MKTELQPALAPQPQAVRELRSQLATAVPGVNDYLRAWADWSLGLSLAPERQSALFQSALAYGADSLRFALQAMAATPAPTANGDAGFAGASWEHWPFNVYAHTHQNLKDWSGEVLAAADGVSPENAQRLEFLRRQWLNLTSPVHYLPTNPELLEQTRREGGANLLRGAQHWIEDLARTLGGGAAPGTENFRVGEQVAVTPGKVVMRNELAELIQYSPQTDSVYAEPILITPAWIMKYYILDLSPHNSLVNYLVGQGHTVFMLSWKNPTAADRNLAMDDYVRLGFRAALDAVQAIVPGRRVHTVGYCIGGTLLSIAAAALARDGDTRIASITLFAAQTDFSEPGELSLFISPSQLAALEAQMQRDGVLSSESMGAAFALLRSSELIWAPAVNQYLRGQRAPLNDLMAWNADGTRMPCRMHSEYLERLYLHNELAAGTFTVDGKPVNLSQITVPMFVVGTETDHVAPWHSAFKTRALTRSNDYSFVLTSGGHNAGIISGPVNPKRRHRVYRWSDATAAASPDQYLADAQLQAGSWWPTWQQWLVAHSAPGLVAPPPLGNSAAGYVPLADAPGGYVRG
ncbi:MAG: alpha/beta fold hydrolase [Proteobacteria bacterium]|nr:alpha/beta fold hydrolase [Pseudomonadota bacterium]